MMTEQENQQKLRRQHITELMLVLLIFVAVNLISLAFQERMTVNEGRGADGSIYYNMASQIRQGQLPAEMAPLAFRIAIPFLASLVPGDLIESFFIVNLAANLLAIVLLFLWLKLFVSDYKIRLLLCVLFITQWHGPVRFLYFTPTYIDPWLFVVLLAGLILIHNLREKPAENQRWVLALATLSFIGALIRESAIIIPVAVLFVNNPLRSGPVETLKQFRMQPLTLYLPLLCGILGISITHLLAHDPYTHYSFHTIAAYWLTAKSPMLYLHAWFITFGPIIVVLLPYLRALSNFIARHQYQLAYLLCIAVLGQIGGTDTERFLFWGMPVIYVLIGKALESGKTLFAFAGLVAVLAIGQAVSQRIFWAIPDYPGENVLGYPSILPLLTPWSSKIPYLDLLSYRSHPQVEIASLCQYLVLVLVLGVWITFRARKLNVRAMLGNTTKDSPSPDLVPGLGS